MVEFARRHDRFPHRTFSVSTTAKECYSRSYPQSRAFRFFEGDQTDIIRGKKHLDFFTVGETFFLFLWEISSSAKNYRTPGANSHRIFYGFLSMLIPRDVGMYLPQ